MRLATSTFAAAALIAAIGLATSPAHAGPSDSQLATPAIERLVAAHAAELAVTQQIQETTLVQGGRGQVADEELLRTDEPVQQGIQVDAPQEENGEELHQTTVAINADDAPAPANFQPAPSTQAPVGQRTVVVTDAQPVAPLPAGDVTERDLGVFIPPHQ